MGDLDMPGAAPDPRDLRCSDDDREKVAEALRAAAADGRIDLDELHDRIGRTYEARTYRQLEPLVADLPGAPGAARPALPAPASPRPAGSPGPLDRLGGVPTSGSAVAVMSGTARTGTWVLPASFTALALMGEVTLDLREARFESAEVTVYAVAIMGGVKIVVPPDIGLRVDGAGVMGAFEGPTGTAKRDHRVSVRVTGLALMGGVEVKRRDEPPRRAVEP